MGNIYGPPDHELKQCEENAHKRTQVIEERLLPILGELQNIVVTSADGFPPALGSSNYKDKLTSRYRYVPIPVHLETVFCG